MARKKQEETKQVAPSKKSAKPAKKVEKSAPKTAVKPAAKKTKADKPAKPAKVSKKAKPESTKRASHPAVDSAVVMAAFGGSNRTKKELVDACGGDEVAVTKTLKILRGEGKIAVKGSTRSAVYSAA